MNHLWEEIKDEDQQRVELQQKAVPSVSDSTWQREDRLLASRRHGSSRAQEGAPALRSRALLREALERNETAEVPNDETHLIRWKVPSGLLATFAVLLALITVWATVSGLLSGSTETVSLASSPAAETSSHEGIPQENHNKGRAVGAATLPSVGEVTVHVAGAVAQPGVYTLPAGSRLNDAVVAAGGPLPEANTGAINLAGELVDGVQVYVPAVGETAMPVPAGSAPAGTPVTGSSELVNINTASAEELQTLPKVGPVLAESIIAWREEHGGFQSIEELDQVSGIGPATLQNLRDLVTV